MTQFKIGQSGGVAQLGISTPFLEAPERPDHLIDRCRRGDREAFKQLYHRYHQDVARIIASFVSSRLEHEDLIQETFIQVYRSIARFRGRSAFSTWLYRVAINTSLQQLRKKRPKTCELDDQRLPDEQGGSCPHRKLLQKEQGERIFDVLAKLDLKKRTVLILHHIHGFTTQRISEILQVSAATVRTRLFYGRRQFVALWEQRDMEVADES